jgi:hypothetical protein
MLPAVLEKATFAVAAVVLFAQHRVSGMLLAFGLIDGMLGVLFLYAFLRLRPSH